MKKPADYEAYAADLGYHLKERARSAKEAQRGATGTLGEFAAGRVMGLHEAVSLMQEQAIAFGIPLEAVNLGDIDPERDLV